MMFLRFLWSLLSFIGMVYTGGVGAVYLLGAGVTTWWMGVLTAGGAIILYKISSYSIIS